VLVCRLRVPLLPFAYPKPQRTNERRKEKTRHHDETVELGEQEGRMKTEKEIQSKYQWLQGSLFRREVMIHS
jgi:hypothetical protein